MLNLDASQPFRTIFPNATRHEIRKYKRQLARSEESEPFIVIVPNERWINQYGLPAFDTAMDQFAVQGLPLGQRRDDNSRRVFGFKDLAEIYAVRAIMEKLVPNAFCIPPSFRDRFPKLQHEPLGYAWIVMKIGSNEYDYGHVDNFFLIP
jgi:hypothetical protein